MSVLFSHFDGGPSWEDDLVTKSPTTGGVVHPAPLPALTELPSRQDYSTSN